MVDVGIPAKSGVSGGIFGVVPGVCGVAVFSPKLNPTYNSVRGIQAFNELSRRLRLHVLKKKKPPTWMEAITGRRKDRGADAAVSTISSSVFKSAAEKEQKAAKIAALNEQVSAKGDIPAGKIAWAESEVKPLI